MEVNETKKTETKPTAEKKPETKVEVKAEAKVETKSEVKSEVKPAEKKAEVKPAEKKAEVKAEAKPAEKKVDAPKQAAPKQESSTLKFVENVRIFSLPSAESASRMFSGNVQILGKFEGYTKVSYVKPGFGAVIGYIQQ